MQLVACCGRDEQRVADFANESGATPWIDLRRMLDASSLDLLIVALPPMRTRGRWKWRLPLAFICSSKNPIALDMQRADAMVDAARHARSRRRLRFHVSLR